jgi:predicted transcriptional regulator
MALLVEDGMLIGVVERTDVLAPIDDRTLVREVARLDGRTIGRDAALADALALMRRTGRRRLAAIDEAGALAGLLCLKSSGRGFCSDRDVAGRRM